MILRTYKMTNDTGFAPNPFHGYLTLATCKPYIRLKASIGEWVAGFTSKSLDGSELGKEKLIYLMKIEEKLSFDDYFNDPRFKAKKPKNVENRFKVGDNIYYCAKRRICSPFHKQQEEIIEDIKGKFVLASKTFWYFGKCALEVPKGVRPNVPRGPAPYGIKTEAEMAKKFIEWVQNKFPRPGIYGPPHEFKDDSWKRDINFVTALCS